MLTHVAAAAAAASPAIPFWVTFLLTLPITSSVIGVVGAFVAPGARWSRQLRNDLAIYRDLPDGAAKAALRKSTADLADRLIDYRTMKQTDKLFTWVPALLLASAVVSLCINPADFVRGMQLEYGPTWFVIALLSTAFSVFGAACAFTGRNLSFQTTSEYRAYLSSERRLNAQARNRRRARRRAQEAGEQRSDGDHPARDHDDHAGD